MTNNPDAGWKLLTSLKLSSTSSLEPVFICLIFTCLVILRAHGQTTGTDAGRLMNTTSTFRNNQTSLDRTTSPPSATETVTPLPSFLYDQSNSTDSSSSRSAEVLLSGEEFVDYTEAPTLLFDNLTTDNRNTTNETSSHETTLSNNNNNNNNTDTTLPEDDSESEEIEDSDEEDKSSTGEPKIAFQAPQNVSQYMDYIERLFHDLRHQITDLFEPHLPQLIRTSQMVQLSGACTFDMLRMALALRAFEPWALRMIDSSGKMPEGIFEGSFTALGSYDECLNTVFASSSSSSSSSSKINQDLEGAKEIIQPTQGKYCLVNVSPYLPPKPPADKVERMFEDEANRRNYSSENQFSRLSPMFYYMKFRIGVCLPSTCEDSDMESLSTALSSSVRLNITIPHCKVKQVQPITKHQLIGGVVFGLVLISVIGATLIEYCTHKLHRQEALVVQSLPTTCSVACLNEPTSMKQNETTGEIGANSIVSSFSLLTNFRLYFKLKQGSDYDQDRCQRRSSDRRNMIRCLNGIRVLSLCWVIVANSYITLDPRATKRLTKTREAPRDFLFQVVVQASLAIETFFFLSGLLMSLSFARLFGQEESEEVRKDKANSTMDRPQSGWLRWIQLYAHRYIRMTPATMLVIAFTMFAFRYGDGPLWFEATNKAHESCSRNWWRHLLHVANFIDTRQMCFIHYWYIAADMQLFLLAAPLLYLIYRKPRLGYLLASLVSLGSIGSVFYTTYTRNLPPTLLFYNSDPESRRDFGNSVMTKPLTHALPYLVGMMLGHLLAASNSDQGLPQRYLSRVMSRFRRSSAASIVGLLATLVALAEVFLPYKWNNSNLPSRLMGALYASLFRLAWSLVLAYLVLWCQHERGKDCKPAQDGTNKRNSKINPSNGCERPFWLVQGGKDLCPACGPTMGAEPMLYGRKIDWPMDMIGDPKVKAKFDCALRADFNHSGEQSERAAQLCLCPSGGTWLNRFLSLKLFAHLSRLSFVAYLIHLPLMSVFVAQTRGLFAFSHMLVIHLALSYLLMTFILSFVLVHIIELPFITLERYLFARISGKFIKRNSQMGNEEQQQQQPQQHRHQHQQVYKSRLAAKSKTSLFQVPQMPSSQNVGG